ncbi:MAG: ABC transporter substrate-binding protein [Anaerolineae bacterium]
MEAKRRFSRRRFVASSVVTAFAAGLAACGATPTPQVIEKVIEKEVTKIVEGTPQVVKETVVVTEVVKETVIVEAGAVPTATKVPGEIDWVSFQLGLPGDAWPHGKWESQLADTYMAEHPEIKVNYQALGWDSLDKVYTSITAGNPPHLVLRGGIDQLLYAKEGNVLLEVELPDDLREDLYPGWYDGMLYKGTLHMVPFYAMSQGMVLNLSIVEEAGASDLLPVGPDRSGWNFDQYTELMSKCTYKRSDGTQVYGRFLQLLGVNPLAFWTTLIEGWNWGTDEVESQNDTWRCKLGDEQGIAWMQWLYDLYAKYQVMPNPAGMSTGPSELWDQGSLLQMTGPAGSFATQEGMEVNPDTLVIHDGKRNFDWTFMQYPTGPGVDHSIAWGGPKLDSNLVPFRREEANIKPTIDFALWLVNKDNQNFLAKYLPPCRVSAAATVTDAVSKWMLRNWIPYGRQRASAEGGRSRETMELFQLALQKIFADIPVKDAVSEFCSKVDALEWL